jgi:hypothetical protein
MYNEENNGIFKNLTWQNTPAGPADLWRQAKKET